MSGETALTRMKLEDVLKSFKNAGAVAVEINAEVFRKTCEFKPSSAVVCDVLREGEYEVVEHPKGGSGYANILIVRKVL